MLTVAPLALLRDRDPYLYETLVRIVLGSEFHKPARGSGPEHALACTFTDCFPYG